MDIALKLPYRDFITLGICIEDTDFPYLYDNWIYVQEKDVKVGRIQFFHNWSPYLLPRRDVIWLGMEFFATEGDELWRLSENEMKRLAVDELLKLGIVNSKDKVLFAHVVKVKKAYPAYWGGYKRIDQIKGFLNSITNFYTIGRNGLHRYNNQDHSMLSAMEAVKNIYLGIKDKDNIWMVNVEESYHEEGSFKINEPGSERIS